MLDLTPDELLTTTRAVRKRLDFEKPVPIELIRECLEIALQAPSGSNAQGWHFMVVTDDEKKRKLAELYRKAFDVYRGMDASAHALAKLQNDDADRAQMDRVVGSAEYLAENLELAPALIIPCIEGRSDIPAGPLTNVMQTSVLGSILPAFWSFMLAARARGLGTSWTTLHLMHEKEAADLLGIDASAIMQVALSPIAFTKGTEFKPARRKPLDGVLHVDSW